MDDLAISGNSIHPEQTEIIMYQTEDGLTKIDVRMKTKPFGRRRRRWRNCFNESAAVSQNI